MVMHIEGEELKRLDLDQAILRLANIGDIARIVFMMQRQLSKTRDHND